MSLRYTFVETPAPYRPQGNECWWLRCVLWNALGVLMEVPTHVSDWDDANGMMLC